MINGLAIWHYTERPPIENMKFFSDNGFKSVSVNGQIMNEICSDKNLLLQLESVIKTKNLVLNVHYSLPATHDAGAVSEFEKTIDSFATCQKEYGLITVLSFDVPEAIRDNVLPYICYVLQYEEFSKVAVEDFGLNNQEKTQIEMLKSNKRFGYLIDIGHMYIRLCGKTEKDLTMLRNQPEECAKTDSPGYTDFMRAFSSKDFPVFEIHLSDNDGKSDSHHFFGDGNLDMKMIADVLRDINYDGPVTIESRPRFAWKKGYCPFGSDDRIIETLRKWENVSGKNLLLL